MDAPAVTVTDRLPLGEAVCGGGVVGHQVDGRRPPGEDPDALVRDPADSARLRGNGP